jgi:erythromycin esterase-like protein
MACQSFDKGNEREQKDFEKWVHASAVEIKNDSKEVAFDQMAEAFGQARIVAISEAGHNTHEFIATNADIINHLVKEHGFNTVVVESGLPESKTVHDYILGADIDKKEWVEGLNGMYSQWKPFNEMVENLRLHNQQVSEWQKKLKFIGVDITGEYKDLRPAFKMVTDYLDRIEPVYANEQKELILPVLNIFCARVRGEGRVNYLNKLSVEQRCDLEKNFRLMVEHLTINKEAYFEKSSHVDYEWARQSAVSLVQTVNYYNSFLNEKHQQPKTNTGLNMRDLAMAQNLDWVFEMDSLARVIVLSHNVHTKKGSGYVDDSWGFFTPFAAYIDQKYGDDFYSIGCTYNTGVYWENWKKPKEEPRIVPTKDAEPGELDYLFKKVGKDCFYVDIKSIANDRPAARFLNKTINIREHQYPTPITPNEFDGFIYYERISVPEWDK